MPSNKLIRGKKQSNIIHLLLFLSQTTRETRSIPSPTKRTGSRGRARLKGAAKVCSLNVFVASLRALLQECAADLVLAVGVPHAEAGAGAEQHGPPAATEQNQGEHAA